MFEIGWSELLVIGVVLIVVVGPKDLPRMLRTFGKTTSHLRKMAGDFRRQFDEALREAELDDVRETVRDIGRMDPRSHIRDALDPIRAVGDEIRSSLRSATKAPEPSIPSPTASAAPSAPPQPATTAGVSDRTEPIVTSATRASAAETPAPEAARAAAGDRL